MKVFIPELDIVNLKVHSLVVKLNQIVNTHIFTLWQCCHVASKEFLPRLSTFLRLLGYEVFVDVFEDHFFVVLVVGIKHASPLDSIDKPVSVPVIPLEHLHSCWLIYVVEPPNDAGLRDVNNVKREHLLEMLDVRSELLPHRLVLRTIFELTQWVCKFIGAVAQFVNA